MQITKHQEEILSLLKNRGYFIVTTEGRNYKVWLEDTEGNKVRALRKDTVSNLYDLNKIKNCAEKYGKFYYTYRAR